MITEECKTCDAGYDTTPVAKKCVKIVCDDKNCLTCSDKATCTKCNDKYTVFEKGCKADSTSGMKLVTGLSLAAVGAVIIAWIIWMII